PGDGERVRRAGRQRRGVGRPRLRESADRPGRQHADGECERYGGASQVSEAGSGVPGDRRSALLVPCHVSERWLRFEEREQYEVLDEDLIQFDVMTRDDEGEPYKL